MRCFHSTLLAFHAQLLRAKLPALLTVLLISLVRKTYETTLRGATLDDIELVINVGSYYSTSFSLDLQNTHIYLQRFLLPTT